MKTIVIIITAHFLFGCNSESMRQYGQEQCITRQVKLIVSDKQFLDKDFYDKIVNSCKQIYSKP